MPQHVKSLQQKIAKYLFLWTVIQCLAAFTRQLEIYSTYIYVDVPDESDIETLHNWSVMFFNINVELSMEMWYLCLYLPIYMSLHRLIFVPGLLRLARSHVCPPPPGRGPWLVFHVSICHLILGKPYGSAWSLLLPIVNRSVLYLYLFVNHDPLYFCSFRANSRPSHASWRGGFF